MLTNKLRNYTLTLFALFALLTGVANAQSWATAEYVQKKRIEVEGRIRDYGRMLVSNDDRDWRHLKSEYLKQLPSITSDDEYKKVMDGLARQEWRSIRLNSVKADCDGIPKLSCETFVYEIVTEAIAPYVNEKMTWREIQKSHAMKLQAQEDEKNRIAASMNELRTVAEIAADRERVQIEIAEERAKERAEREAQESKARVEREAQQKVRKQEFLEFITNDFWKELSKTPSIYKLSDMKFSFSNLDFVNDRSKSTIPTAFVYFNKPGASKQYYRRASEIAVQSIINWFMKEGFNPQKNNLFIEAFVVTLTGKKSPTGEDLIDGQALSAYSPIKDAIIFLSEDKK